MNLDLKYYLTVFLRRSPYFILVTAVFASVGFTVALVLPPEYESRAVLLVESEQIPDRLAASTVQVQASEQLRIIEQRLLSRQVLLDIANELDLYPTEAGSGRMNASEIVEDMRNRTSFAFRGTAASRRGSTATTILEITFRSESAGRAAETANEFVTRVLQQNVELRTEQAGDTLEFFEQEVDRLGRELDAQSVELINFQNDVGIAVPSNMTFLRSRLDSLTSERSEARQSLVSLEDQRRRLIELFEVSAIGPGGASQRSPLEQELVNQRAALSEALLVYSEQNPRVTLLRARVSQLEERLEQQRAAALESGADDEAAQDELAPPRSERQIRFEAEIEDIDRRIASLKEEIERIDVEIPEIEENLTEAAANGITLNKLQRDYDNIQGQYNEAVARLSVAATGERIELLAKGQRISVIEQAIAPNRPTKPNRPMIAAAGVGAGMLSGVALVVLLEFLNRSIRRPAELTSRLGITPFAVLPYIRTRREIAIRRTVILGAVAGLAVLVPLGLFAVHTFAFPMDAIIERIFNRFGFSVL
jgi:polysaccharide chain length determinant protein (PEP-CTERM system associated)